MKQQEIKERYDYARAQAIREIDDLNQGGDPEKVYRAMEIATLWKVVLGTGGKLPINYAVMSEMLGATNAKP